MDLVQSLKRVVPRGLHPRLGAARRFVRSLPPRTAAQKVRLLDDASLDERERELLRAASSRIHYGDGMYKGDGAHYYKVGLSALRRIDEAVESAGLRYVRTILDLPCGYGRVMRFLVRRFPEARVTACEIDRAGVDFCVSEFGAAAAYSSADIDSLYLGAHFDLVWCGSLVTHLDADPVLALLKLFRRHLAPGGLAIFTAHGDFVARRMPTRDFDYGLTDGQIARITDAYARDGFAYTDYPDRESYGISLTSPVWVREQARRVGSLREVYFKERGWDEHQDVYGFVLEDV
jgi:SAM-dependent methyltransferase